MLWTELAARLAADIAVGRWEGERLPGVRRLARQAGCSPATAARAYAALRDAGVIAGAPRQRFEVTAEGRTRAASWGAGAAGVLVAGSDDPALDLLIRGAGGSVSVAPGARGSVQGLAQLARGTADAAAVHLLDASTGTWNDSFARGALAGGPALLLHLWRREQGLVLQPGNPRGVRGIADLAGLRVAWRPPGTGSRLLLERLMLLEGAQPRPELGVPADTHLAVATAVATGAAHAGLAVRTVAESLGLEWIPVATESFELAMPAEPGDAAEPLLQVLATGALHARLAGMPGYDLAMSGETRLAA